MNFRFRFKRPLREEFPSLGRDLAEAAAGHLGEGDIHQTRRRIKEIRALLALARGDLQAGELGRRFRDVARALSGARDDEICLSTLERLRGEAGAPPEAAFVKARAALHHQSRQHRQLDTAGALGELEAARRALQTWQPAAGRKALRRALRHSCRRARKALQCALAQAADDPGEEPLHRLRRRVKRLWAQLRLLSGAAKPIRKADKAAELLGLKHDLAVLQARLQGSAAGKPFAGLLAGERARLRARALAKARRLLRRKPKAFLRKAGVDALPFP